MHSRLAQVAKDMSRYHEIQTCLKSYESKHHVSWKWFRQGLNVCRFRTNSVDAEMGLGEGH